MTFFFFFFSVGSLRYYSGCTRLGSTWRVQSPEHRKSHDPVQKPIRNWKRTVVVTARRLRAPPSVGKRLLKTGQKHLNWHWPKTFERVLCVIIIIIIIVSGPSARAICSNVVFIGYNMQRAYARAEGKMDSLTSRTPLQDRRS